MGLCLRGLFLRFHLTLCSCVPARARLQTFLNAFKETVIAAMAATPMKDGLPWSNPLSPW
jgi:hypothetical protein